MNKISSLYAQHTYFDTCPIFRLRVEIGENLTHISPTVCSFISFQLMTRITYLETDRHVFQSFSLLKQKNSL